MNSRRQFLATTGGTAAALAVSSCGNDDDESAGPTGDFIDAHVHVWTPDTTKYPLAEGFDQSSMQPPSFTPEELFAECKPHGVSRIVLIQMSFYKHDNSYMVDMMKAHPGVFGGVAIVDENEPGVMDRMNVLKADGVRGFRLYANKENASKWQDSDGMLEMWANGAGEGLAMCLLADPDALPSAISMCERFPETPVVVDHFARIGMRGEVDQAELDQLLKLADFKHTYVKVSAFYALGSKVAPYYDLRDMIQQLRDAYGAERLMWATDCPYQVQNGHTYEASIALIRDHCDFLSADEKSAILKGTAEKVFFS